MKTEILEFVGGAKNARGIAVIIDVFRAFSVACYSFDAGASQYIAAVDVPAAHELKNRYKSAILIGERNERKIEGFDLGNSPTEILQADLSGKTIIHTTTAGTQGLINAKNATSVITGSLVNANAIVRYLESLKPENISLVAMGYRAEIHADEDLLCAKIIAERLSGRRTDYSNDLSMLKNNSGKRFFNPKNIEFSPPTDFFLCTMLDRFNFVLKAEQRTDGNIALVKIDI
jgi:2-phosphosulfolactate phosphatase